MEYQVEHMKKSALIYHTALFIPFLSSRNTIFFEGLSTNMTHYAFEDTKLLKLWASSDTLQVRL